MIYTNYGNLSYEYGCEYYEDGSIKSCKFNHYNVINTTFGKLIPKYQINETRTRDRVAVEFFNNGKLKSIYLEKSTNIITSAGIITCEFIKFYESGKIHRVFPTYGKVGGTWTEEEEINVTPRIKMNIHGIPINNKLSCICFYENGSVKSISLYSGEIACVKVKDGELEVRYGISFHKNGMIQSIEPATATLINSPIGILIAYDNNPLGIHGDSNSLQFDESGDVYKVTTIQTGIEIIDKDNKKIYIQPLRKPSWIDIDKIQMFPIKIAFLSNGMSIINSNGQQKFYDNNHYQFATFYNQLYRSDNCINECSKCKGCH